MESLQNLKKSFAAVNKDVMSFINSFVDDKSFVETDAFVCSKNGADAAVGDGVVSGFAAIADRGVCVFAFNSDVMKGAVGELNAKKVVRAVNAAVRMNKPLIAVWDTAGAKICDGIGALDGYGSILRAYTVAYGQVPVISVIRGNNFGISAYVAGISDFVISYSDSTIASASPLVVAAKCGCDIKSIGSADIAAKTGISTHTVKTDKELRTLLCEVLGIFDGKVSSGDDLNRVCKGLKLGAKPESLIKEVFDKGSYIPVRAEFAPVVSTGFATLGDIVVGVVATDGTISDGRITSDACIKISEFLNICDHAECPIVFMVDSVGTEHTVCDASLIREMSNLIYQVNALGTDMFAVIYGKAIGAAYTALVVSCEYKIAWDGAEIGALDSQSSARLLYADDIKTAKNKDVAAQKLAADYACENSSAIAVARVGYLDNVIEPDLTRSYLLAALSAHLE